MDDANDAVKRYLNDANIVVDQLFQKELSRFGVHATRAFYFHRITGISLLFLSSSLPFISTVETDVVRKIILPAVAVAIAFLSGLMSFMTYGESWKNYRKSEIRVRYAHERWNTQVLATQFEKDPEKALAQAKEAASSFLQTMEGIVDTETESFFKKLDEADKTVAKNHP